MLAPTNCSSSVTQISYPFSSEGHHSLRLCVDRTVSRTRCPHCGTLRDAKGTLDLAR
ncbi:hypothetical protein VDGL01_03981 [Verticillium dahliae]